MPSTTPYKRGDIVLVPFPFTDLSSAKQRPALVISPDAFNRANQDVVLLAITSQIPPSLGADEFLIPANELSACGLPKPSLVRLMKIFTLHQRLILQRRGALPNAALTQLLDQFQRQFRR
jgi:mRNA interferase MazF